MGDYNAARDRDVFVFGLNEYQAFDTHGFTFTDVLKNTASAPHYALHGVASGYTVVATGLDARVSPLPFHEADENDGSRGGDQVASSGLDLVPQGVDPSSPEDVQPFTELVNVAPGAHVPSMNPLSFLSKVIDNTPNLEHYGAACAAPHFTASEGNILFPSSWFDTPSGLLAGPPDDFYVDDALQPELPAWSPTYPGDKGKAKENIPPAALYPSHSPGVLEAANQASFAVGSSNGTRAGNSNKRAYDEFDGDEAYPVSLPDVQYGYPPGVFPTPHPYPRHAGYMPPSSQPAQACMPYPPQYLPALVVPPQAPLPGSNVTGLPQMVSAATSLGAAPSPIDVRGKGSSRRPPKCNANEPHKHEKELEELAAKYGRPVEEIRPTPLPPTEQPCRWAAPGASGICGLHITPGTKDARAHLQAHLKASNGRCEWVVDRVPTESNSATSQLCGSTVKGMRRHLDEVHMGLHQAQCKVCGEIGVRSAHVIHRHLPLCLETTYGGSSSSGSSSSGGARKRRRTALRSA